MNTSQDLQRPPGSIRQFLLVGAVGHRETGVELSEGDKVVPVDVTDTEGKTVFTARITMNIKLS